jgi:cytochrome c-type biogenesis protein CcmH/NrfG
MGNYKLASFCVQHAATVNENVLKETISNAALLTMATSQLEQPPIGVQMKSSNELIFNTLVNQSVTQQAIVYSFLHEHQRAIDVLESELRAKPSSTLFNLLGRVLMKAKKWNDAIIAFEKSIKFDVTTI